MVASTSAFISTTGLPWAKASRMTLAPNSTEPVTSTTTSISGDRQMVIGSSATAGRPPRTASSSADWVGAATGSRPE
jgi:hypothetical protein